MRIWSIHPKYLDAKGLVAAWREGLLAQKVLEGKTRGYRNHSQLIRFREAENPLESIGIYLSELCAEAERRGYNFDFKKIKIRAGRKKRIPVSDSQGKYEFELLKYKLENRDLHKLNEIRNERLIEVNNAFRIINGEIENWEKIITAIKEKIE